MKQGFYTRTGYLASSFGSARSLPVMLRKPLALLFLVVTLLPACAVAHGEAPGILVQNGERRFSFRLPAPYWQCYSHEELAAQMQGGGCGGQQVPPLLLYLAGHKDAPAQALIYDGVRPYLMRDQDELEAFVDAIVDDLKQRLRANVQVIESKYTERDGMIIHRSEFTAIPGGGGSPCGALPGSSSEPQVTHCLLMNYFVHPKGEDARYLQLFCLAPDEVYQELKPEIEFLSSSVRYTGETAQEFFTPDAAEEKVLRAEDAKQAAGRGQSKISGSLLPIAAIVMIWLLLRRRKKNAA